MRAIHHRYEDPLDRLWLACAERVGLRVLRKAGAYASTDGHGTLEIAIPEELDPDDSLAQMVFHELCHALVEGPESFEKEDWGLDNTSDDDVLREHACVRLQAFLSRSRGLGTFFAVTTDFRAFHDALPADPLEGDPRDRSIILAKQALARVRTRPWAPHLTEALDATAALARTVSAFAGPDPAGDRVSLWGVIEDASASHPVGLPLARAGTAASREVCRSCGFCRRTTRGLGCTKAGARTSADHPACERWEPALACESCGACCREAFDVIEVGAREPFAKRHRALLVVRESGALDLPRPGGRCPPLVGDGTAVAPYRCTLHAERPRTCRDFALGGEACLTARRRVGLST